jgi:hypothetical protein
MPVDIGVSGSQIFEVKLKLTLLAPLGSQAIGFGLEQYYQLYRASSFQTADCGTSQPA